MSTKSESNTDYANLATVKMSISEAHHKLGHIAHGAIGHMIRIGAVAGIKIDPELKPEFCESCAKAKSACHPFPQESLTHASKYGEQVHWDLWGPPTVQSIDGYFYVAVHINDATHETVIYFQ